MTPQGEQIIKAVHQVREFYSELANLLLTIDSMMREQGWTSAIGSACLGEVSYSVNRPEAWMPFYVYRFYTSARHPTILLSACAAVECSDPQRLQEPLLIGQAFQYGSLKREEWQFPQNMANWHLWMPQRVDDGTVLAAVDPRSTFPDEGCLAEKLTTFARPLVEFTDTESVKDRLVTPLLNAASSFVC